MTTPLDDDNNKDMDDSNVNNTNNANDNNSDNTVCVARTKTAMTGKVNMTWKGIKLKAMLHVAAQPQPCEQAKNFVEHAPLVYVKSMLSGM